MNIKVAGAHLRQPLIVLTKSYDYSHNATVLSRLAFELRVKKKEITDLAKRVKSINVSSS